MIGQGPDFLRPHVDHRFDGDNEPSLEFEVVVPAERRGTEVGNLRVLVHLLPDAMANEVLHHRKPAIPDIGRHLGGNIAPAIPLSDQLDRQLEDARSAVEEPSDDARHRPHRMSPGGIAAPTGKATTGVDADDVAFHENPWAGNTVHHLVVDGNAAHRRKRHLSGHPLEQRHRPALEEVRFHRGIDFTGRHPRPDHRGGDFMGAPDDKARTAHERDFAGRPKIHHGRHTHSNSVGKRGTGRHPRTTPQSPSTIAA